VDLEFNKSEWKEINLGCLATEVSERVDKPSFSKFERFVGLEHFESGRLEISNYSSTENLTSAAKVFKSGDVLFARRNVYLRRASSVTFDGICSGDAFVLRENPEVIEPGFLALLLNSNSLWNYAIANAAGTMSKRVKWRDLANFRVCLPPKVTQREIISLVWSNHSLINSNYQLLASTKAFQETYFENLVKDNASDRTKLRDVLTNIFAGKSPKGFSRPANCDEYAVLKVSAVGNKKYVATENKALIDQSEFNPIYEVQEGFILVTRANANLSGVGRPCLVKSTRKGLMLSDKTLRLIPDLEKVRNRFLYQLVQTKMYRQYVESVAGGTEAKNISQKLLGNAPVWLPSMEMQKEVESELFKQDEAIEAAEKHYINSKRLQASIINKVF